MRTPGAIQIARRPLAFLLTGCAALVFTSAAGAQVSQSYSSSVLTPVTGAIHDPTDATGANYNGSLATMLGLSLTVPDAPGPIQSVYITVNIEHTFVGDLTIKLVSPTGTIVTVLNRPGSGAPDDGSAIGGAGASANLSVAIPIAFDDAISQSAEDMGFGLGGDDIIGGEFSPDNDAATGVGPFTDAGLGSFSAFAGENPVGTWTLYVADSGAYNTGYLQKWRLNLTMVPEPSSLLLLLLGATSLIRRR